ncbi:MAG: hypothetical protein ACRDB0_07355 [Paraclostridium sp.]
MNAICDNISNKHREIDADIICKEMLKVSIKGMPVFTQVELFKDVCNVLLDDCVSLIKEDGDFI